MTFAARSGAFFGLLTTAFMIKVGRRLCSNLPVARGLAFATSSYAMYFLLEIRGYSLMFFAANSLFVDFLPSLAETPQLARSLVLSSRKS